MAYHPSTPRTSRVRLWARPDPKPDSYSACRRDAGFAVLAAPWPSEDVANLVDRLGEWQRERGWL